MTAERELEVFRAATRAWLAMAVEYHGSLRAPDEHAPGPMPACVALDMVQDVTGDRDDAAIELHAAAAAWLENQIPQTLLDGADHRGDAGVACGHLRGMAYGTATAITEGIRESATRVSIGGILHPRSVTPFEVESAKAWLAWGWRVLRAAKLLRAVDDAAG